jgi:protein tyrosine phosphatase (PTP) superfamily phosphohydrolase (DUF442 family)
MRNSIENIFNYLRLDDKIATGGQPTEKQLALIRDEGYQIVINLALDTSDNALPDEKAVVESTGMQYIQIPIDFNHPTQEEFDLFCEAMQTHQDKKIFIHCAANLRVSAFMYLYRTLYQNMSEAEAKQDLHKLWQPNPTWQNIINTVSAKR